MAGTLGKPAGFGVSLGAGLKTGADAGFALLGVEGTSGAGGFGFREKAGWAGEGVDVDGFSFGAGGLNPAGLPGGMKGEGGWGLSSGMDDN